jgi:hypothetical protein
MPSEHLAVVSINDEDDAGDVAVPAGDLEDIGAPAQVRAHHNHFAVMQAALATARVALEEKSLPLHDPETRLWVAVGLLAIGSRDQGAAIAWAVHEYVTSDDADPEGYADKIAVLLFHKSDCVSRELKGEKGRCSK